MKAKKRELKPGKKAKDLFLAYEDGRVSAFKDVEKMLNEIKLKRVTIDENKLIDDICKTLLIKEIKDALKSLHSPQKNANLNLSADKQGQTGCLVDSRKGCSKWFWPGSGVIRYACREGDLCRSCREKK